MGKALSFLFGVISEGDLDQIKESVKKLADSQQTIIHVVKKQYLYWTFLVWKLRKTDGQLQVWLWLYSKLMANFQNSQQQ